MMSCHNNGVFVCVLCVTAADASQASSWCKGLLKKVFDHTPHSWSPQTLASFPPPVQEFFSQNKAVREDKTALQRAVEMDFNKWRSRSPYCKIYK